MDHFFISTVLVRLADLTSSVKLFLCSTVCKIMFVVVVLFVHMIDTVAINLSILAGIVGSFVGYF